ncbi:MAG: PUR family DNA/RNA-binding protein [Prevotellaceae bacterium]|jgi:hypothetical protein|nr:PUR family DNA/RNA-binding protein [Prevotellaceae bacterium]
MENIVHDKEFVFSKAVKAGKRIYYIDVKRTRNSDSLYLSLTESKKIASGDENNPQFSFVKQKLLVYREDLDNFVDALNEVADFMRQASTYERPKMSETKYFTIVSRETEPIKQNETCISSKNIDFDDISFDV